MSAPADNFEVIDASPVRASAQSQAVVIDLSDSEDEPIAPASANLSVTPANVPTPMSQQNVMPETEAVQESGSEASEIDDGFRDFLYETTNASNNTSQTGTPAMTIQSVNDDASAFPTLVSRGSYGSYTPAASSPIGALEGSSTGANDNHMSIADNENMNEIMGSLTDISQRLSQEAARYNLNIPPVQLTAVDREQPFHSSPPPRGYFDEPPVRTPNNAQAQYSHSQSERPVNRESYEPNNPTIEGRVVSNADEQQRSPIGEQQRSPINENLDYDASGNTPNAQSPWTPAAAFSPTQTFSLPPLPSPNSTSISTTIPPITEPSVSTTVPPLTVLPSASHSSERVLPVFTSNGTIRPREPSSEDLVLPSSKRPNLGKHVEALNQEEIHTDYSEGFSDDYYAGLE